jgi:hypothetical protein
MLIHKLKKPFPCVEHSRVKSIYITQIFRVSKVLGNPVPYFEKEKTRAKLKRKGIDFIRNMLIQKLQETYKN